MASQGAAGQEDGKRKNKHIKPYQEGEGTLDGPTAVTGAMADGLFANLNGDGVAPDADGYSHLLTNGKRVRVEVVEQDVRGATNSKKAKHDETEVATAASEVNTKTIGGWLKDAVFRLKQTDDGCSASDEKNTNGASGVGSGWLSGLPLPFRSQGAVGGNGGQNHTNTKRKKVNVATAAAETNQAGAEADDGHIRQCKKLAPRSRHRVLAQRPKMTDGE